MGLDKNLYDKFSLLLFDTIIDCKISMQKLLQVYIYIYAASFKEIIFQKFSIKSTKMEKYQKEIYRGIMQLFLNQIVRKIQKYLSYFVLR